MASNPYESPEHEADLPRQPSKWPAIALRLLAVIAVLGFLVALLLPARRTGVREAMRRMKCSNHLKQIALALQNYEETFGAFPPAYTVDADGKPLHSWRTLILPFMENKPLYDRIDLSKPWDDPANDEARNTNISTYICPSGMNVKSQTTYFAVVASGGCFKPTKPQPIAAITDDKSNTLMVIEVSEKHAAHWMSPNDVTEEMILNREADGKFSHPNGGLAAFADGHTTFLTKNTPTNVLRALISIAGNDNDVARLAD